MDEDSDFSRHARIVRIITFALGGGGASGGVVAVLASRYGSWVFLSFAAIAMVVAAGALLIAARALFVDAPASEVAVQSGRRRKELEREKAALMKASKELSFDHQMGKISDEDFAEANGQYRARTLRIMRQLDDHKVDYAQLVERELAKAEGKAEPPASAPERAPVPVSAARTSVSSSSSPLVLRRCVRCGTTNDADAVFCKKCAAALEVAS